MLMQPGMLPNLPLHHICLYARVRYMSLIGGHRVLVAAAVRKEIADETDRITGKSKQISNVPIHLSVYSPQGLSSGFCIYPFILVTIYSCKNTEQKLPSCCLVTSVINCQSHNKELFLFVFVVPSFVKLEPKKKGVLMCAWIS